MKLELEPMLKKDLVWLLKNLDQMPIETFRLLKQWLSESDPVLEWPLEERLPRIRARVMDVVSREIRTPQPVLARESEAELR